MFCCGLYRTKKSLNKFMRYVFGSIIVFGCFVVYDVLKTSFKIGYDNNISVQTYENNGIRNVGSLYRDFAIEELKESRVGDIIDSKNK